MDGLSLLLPSEIEDGLLKLIKNHPAAKGNSNSLSQPPITSLTVKRYHSIYEKLISYGFNDAQCQGCLGSLVPIGHATLECSLEWLMLNNESSELPPRFTSCPGTLSDTSSYQGQASKGGIKVLSVATRDAPASSPPAAREDQIDDDADEDEGLILASASREDEEKEREESKAASKAWIQKYLEENESGDDDDENQSCGLLDHSRETVSRNGYDSNKEEDGLDETSWKIWSDAREVSRRSGERKASKETERRRMLSLELWTVKQKAAKAKASGNKQLQKTTGQMIKSLKEEMAAIGLHESVAVALAEDHLRKDARSGPLMPPAIDASSIQDDQSAIPLDPEACRKGQEDAVGDDFSMPFDLFDSPPLDSAESEKVNVLSMTSPLLRSSSTHASIALSSIKAGKGNKSRGKEKPPPPVPKTMRPSALLNQKCQAFSFSPPKVQRLQSTLPSSSSSSSSAAYRYSVSIDFGPPRVSNRKSGLHGVREFVDNGDVQCIEDGGWSSVSEAQEASHCRALYEIESALAAAGGKSYDPGSMQRLFLSMGGEHQALWERYQVEGVEVMAREEREREAGLRRAFVENLFSVKQGLQLQPPSSHSQKNGYELDFAEEAQEGHDSKAFEGEDDFGDVKEGVKGEEDERELMNPMVTAAATPIARKVRSMEEIELQSSAMKSAVEVWRLSAEGSKMMQHRAQLPISSVQGEILAALSGPRGYDVIVIQSETGSGKTTQVPQFLLDDMIDKGQGGTCNIITTQPRRIAAISVADRVAAERGEPYPGHPKSTIGSHVRLDAKVHDKTRLTFMTTGILLRRMSNDRGLQGVTHVIIDEVHERTAHVDFLMALLRDRVRLRDLMRPSSEKGEERGEETHYRLKLILMSATLDGAKLSSYFGNCPILSASGRTFPIKQVFLEQAYEEMADGYVLSEDSEAVFRPRYSYNKKGLGGGEGKQGQRSVKEGGPDGSSSSLGLNPHYDSSLYPHHSYGSRTRLNLSRVDESKIDYDLIECLIAHVDEKVIGMQAAGSILVFLPGMGEIKRLMARVEELKGLRGRSWILPMHSNVSKEDQKRAFQLPPQGVRKVVLATNIAETSLTIEDVVCCIDTGRLKEKRYDPKRCMSALVEDFISRDSSKQRRGRAGRVAKGLYIAMFTRHRHDELMRQHQVPEIHRIPLEELVLQVHAMGLGSASEVLSKTLEPPSSSSIESSLSVLEEVGAIIRSSESSSEQLTDLGRYLSRLPLEPRLGKLLVTGCSLSCLAPVCTIAACLSHKSPFLSASFEAGGGGKGDTDIKSIKKGLIADYLPSLDQGSSSGSKAPNAKGSTSMGQLSDHILLVAAFEMWSRDRLTRGGRKQSDIAKKYRLDESVLQEAAELRDQLFKLLIDSGLVSISDRDRLSKAALLDLSEAPWNRNSRSLGMVQAALLSSFSLQVAVSSPLAPLASRAPKRAGQGGAAVEWISGPKAADRIDVGPSSLLSNTLSTLAPGSLILYSDKVKTGNKATATVGLATPIHPLCLMLFSRSLTYLYEESAALVNGWLKVSVSARQAAVISWLRSIVALVGGGRGEGMGGGLVGGGRYEEGLNFEAMAIINDLLKA